MPRSGCSALYGVNPLVLNKISKLSHEIKKRQRKYERYHIRTLELWNLNVKIGDLENLKENGTIE